MGLGWGHNVEAKIFMGIKAAKKLLTITIIVDQRQDKGNSSERCGPWASCQMILFTQVTFYDLKSHAPILHGAGTKHALSRCPLLALIHLFSQLSLYHAGTCINLSFLSK